MKPIDEETAAHDDRRFDLLVDGQLSEPDRRELLLGLDDRADGWRRCALAFLEAQAWKQDFGAIIRPPVAKPTAARPVRRRWLGRHGGTLMAMAASFLVALGLGSLLRGTWRSPVPAVSPGVELAVGEPKAPDPTGPRTLPLGGPNEGSPAADAPANPWQVVQFASTGGPDGTGETIQLPAIRRDKLGGDWPSSRPSAIPGRVLKAFEQTGHQVRRHSELHPYRMPDGQQLVVPVDNYDVHYVGYPAL